MTDDKPLSSQPHQILIPSKAVQLLKTITVRQHRDLKDFADCPLFCKQIETRRLLHLLLAAYPDFLEKNLSENQLRRKVFGTTSTYSIEKLKKIISDMTQVIEKFIAMEALENDPVQSNLYLMQHVAAHQSIQIFEQTARNTETLLASLPQSFHHLYQKWLLERELQGNWADQTTSSQTQRARTRLAFQQHVEAVELLFRCEQLMRERLTQTNPVSIPDEPPILLRIHRMLYEVCSDIQLPTSIFISVFDRIKQLAPQVAARELEDIYLILSNFCTVRFNAGEKNFGKILGEMQNWASTQPQLGRIFQLSESKFLNRTIIIGLSGKLHEMLDEIKKGVAQLPSSSQEDAENMALAFYFYFKNDPQKIIKCLEKVRSQKIWYKPRAHTLRLRALFELALKSGNFHDFDNEMYAYEQYFKRKQDLLALERRESYVQLGKYTKQLASLVRRGDAVSDTDKQQMLADLENEKNQPIGVDWLVRMLKKV